MSAIFKSIRCLADEELNHLYFSITKNTYFSKKTAIGIVHDVVVQVVVQDVGKRRQTKQEKNCF